MYNYNLIIIYNVKDNHCLFISLEIFKFEIILSIQNRFRL